MRRQPAEQSLQVGLQPHRRNEEGRGLWWRVPLQEDDPSGRREAAPADLPHLNPLCCGRGVSAPGPAREIENGTRPERRTSHRCYGGCPVCLQGGTGTLSHVETPIGRRPHPRRVHLAGMKNLMELFRGHCTPTACHQDTRCPNVSSLNQGLLTPRPTTGAPHGMMSTMHATPNSPEDVASYATPVQQRRFITAMNRIAADRPSGAPVRVYISAAPRTQESEKWDTWVGRIRAGLPGRVELLQYEDEFTDRPYNWDSAVDSLDGLIVVGRQKRKGSRVYYLSSGVRRELKSLVATKPVLLYVHGHGLVPVIDCASQVLPERSREHLKLTAPKRWRPDSPTLAAAVDALRPASLTEVRTGIGESHLKHPFQNEAAS